MRLGAGQPDAILDGCMSRDGPPIPQPANIGSSTGPPEARNAGSHPNPGLHRGNHKDYPQPEPTLESRLTHATEAAPVNRLPAL